MIPRIRLLSRALVLVFVAGVASAQRPAVRTIALAPPTATLTTEFTGVGSVRELADGRTLIGSGADKTLFVGDWSKGTTTQIGRTGSGPREFAVVGPLFALRGDSTLMPDIRNGRWLLLHGATIAGTVRTDAPPIGIGAKPLLGADQRGSVIFTGPYRADSTLAVRKTGPDSLLLVRVARATGRADTVAVIRARASEISFAGPATKPTFVSISMNPFVTEEIAELFPDGWIAIARLDPYRVDWIAPDGKRIRGAPLPFEPVRLDEREIRDYLRRLAERNGTEPRDPASFAKWPEVMPPFQSNSLSVVAGPDGLLWIRRPLTAANRNPVYDLIDRRGVLVARVTAGEGVSVIGFGRDVVYTVMADDDGIQHLERRPLPKL